MCITHLEGAIQSSLPETEKVHFRKYGIGKEAAMSRIIAMETGRVEYQELSDLDKVIKGHCMKLKKKVKALVDVERRNTDSFYK